MSHESIIFCVISTIFSTGCVLSLSNVTTISFFFALLEISLNPVSKVKLNLFFLCLL